MKSMFKSLIKYTNENFVFNATLSAMNGKIFSKCEKPLLNCENPTPMGTFITLFFENKFLCDKRKSFFNFTSFNSQDDIKLNSHSY